MNFSFAEYKIRVRKKKIYYIFTYSGIRICQIWLICIVFEGFFPAYKKLPLFLN